MALRRGFKAEANRISLRVRQQLGLHQTDPIDPVVVCKTFDIALVPLSEVDPKSPLLRNSSEFSAVTVPTGFRTAIVHNDKHHPHRRRSNICHELGHCFLGHKCTPPLTEDGNRHHDSGIEEEASFLAGVLLIPNEAAIHIVRTGIVHLAQEIYGVSSSMLTYRLRLSGAHRIYERSIRQVGDSRYR